MLTALSGVALAFPRLGPAVLVCDALLLAAAALDFLRVPRPATLSVERVLPERVGLAREFERMLRVDDARARGLALAVYEAFPASFQVTVRTLDGQEAPPRAADPSGGPDRGEVGADGRLALVRRYRGDLRGLFAFDALRVQLRGPFGLVLRQARLGGAQAIAVEPALANLQRTLRLAASERWQDLGVRLVRRRGGEREFESLRDYVPGDDVRRVDWKAFARRGKPTVRLYEVERGQELVLFVDVGRRMRATVSSGRRRGWSKLDWALDAALQLAAVALSKGDRVGVAAFERGLGAWVAPAKGPRQLARLTRAVFPLQASEHDSDLARALRELAARHRRRATVIVISDVADPYSVALQRRALASASRRHRLVFAALDDPALTEAAEPGTTHPAGVRAAALELVEDRRRALRALATSGARVLDALPADAAAPMLAAWLEERRR